MSEADRRLSEESEQRFLDLYAHVLVYVNDRFDIIEEVGGADKTEEELLAALTDAVREWHAEIAEISGAMTGQHFGEETVEAMHVELEIELERKGYGHLL